MQKQSPLAGFYGSLSAKHCAVLMYQKGNCLDFAIIRQVIIELHASLPARYAPGNNAMTTSMLMKS